MAAPENAGSLDLLSRRIVEMTGNIVCSYLLLFDCMRGGDFATSLRVFLRMAKAQNEERYAYIVSFNPADAADYVM